jgi:hypothetical protein
MHVILKRQVIALFSSCALLALVETSTSAAPFTSGLVDVNFGGGSTSGAGFVGSSGDSWNNTSGTSGSAALVLTDGLTQSGASLTFAAGGEWNAAQLVNGPNANLTDSYLSNNASSPSSLDEAVVTGLDPSGATTYNLYLYNGVPNVAPAPYFTNLRTTGFEVIGSSSQPTSINNAGTTNSSPWISGANYVEVSGITPAADGSLGIEFDAVAGGEGDFAGFQLEAVVPEPASAGFIACGAGAFLLRRRSSKSVARRPW